MIEYDFKVLNDVEFEELSKDLLSAELGVEFKTYRRGADQGIDLKLIGDTKQNVIGQVKHYANSSFSNLINTMKQELDKMKGKEVDRYILVTSYNLTVGNINELMKMMKGLIVKEDDIFDLKRLNTILQKKDNIWIENKYYKLWLSSTSVLNRIINNAQENNINYYLGDIEDKLKLYVITENIEKALKRLNTQNIILIHGEPGVGKTVLGRILVYKYLENDYKLKFVSGSRINELESILSVDSNEKEVIFLDDFLGSNFLDLINKESDQLAFLLERYMNKKNKIVIMTSRSTIYNKSINQFEKLNRLDVEIEKYKLEITSYNIANKAQIFYNHLYFSDIDNKYLEEIKNNKNYLKIIKHKNYTPRLIEFITNTKRILKLEVSEYIDFIFETLSNPEEIWRNEFENNLSNEEQFLVWTLFTFKSNIKQGILQNAFERRYNNEIKENNFTRIQNAFNNSLKILADGFLVFNKNSNAGDTYIDFINPSLRDFLIKYLETNLGERKRILKSIKYIDQLDIFKNLNRDEKEIIEDIVIKNFKDILCINQDKEIFVLKLIVREYKNNNDFECFIEDIMTSQIKQLELRVSYPDDILEVFMDLIINSNISLEKVEKTFKKFHYKERIEYTLLTKVNNLNTFKKYVHMSKITFSEDYHNSIINLENIHVQSNIERLCRQTLSDHFNVFTRYSECSDIDEYGNVFFNEDEAEYILEQELSGLKYSMIYDENISDTILDKFIQDTIEDIYTMSYDDKLLGAIEYIWNSDYKDIDEDLFNNKTYRNENIKEIEVLEMFEGLKSNKGF